MAFLIAIIWGQEPEGEASKLSFYGSSWLNGLWTTSQLTFAFQMMFMLVLGHILALSGPVKKFIQFLVASTCKNTAQAAFWVTLITMMMGLFNWGLGLVFGAVFARQVAESFSMSKKPLNFPLIAAAGYSGLMVWHGGLSGSAPIKVAEVGHFEKLVGQDLPAISISETIFSSMNISASLALLILCPLFFAWLGRRNQGELVQLKVSAQIADPTQPKGADLLDHWRFVGMAFGVIILIFSALLAINHQGAAMGYVNPNWINGVLLGLGLLFHQKIISFIKASEEAIKGSVGILIQFPLYFGIAAIMQSSGLIEMFASYALNSSATGFSLFTFLSSGIVNVFVPSGGGQWVIQGPIIVSASQQFGVPLEKGIMAMAYGDQLTNMLQPFWALPLLGITGLKVKDIIPYTLGLMLLGTAIFITVLLIF
ncbi:MAG: short-chain fatty acid transporter [Flavobacteriales bacterium]|nr:short-chain fatty acid transporter [Flavobacteriales bacterium]